MVGRSWMRRGLALAVLTLLLATAVVGCGSKQPQGETPQQPAGGEQPGSGGAEERLLRVAFANVPLLDPAVGSDEASSAALANLYDTLVFPNDDGTVRPHLATDWEVSEDGLTYTFNLRQGVKFHDGTELTADDVVFTLERVLTIGEGYGYLFTNTVAGARALDRYKVEVTLKKPFGPFLSALVRLYIVNKKLIEANIDPNGSYGDKGDYGKGYLLTHDAGSGPYTVQELREGEYLLMKRFPDFWGGFDPDNPDAIQMFGKLEPATTRTMLSRQELEVSDQYQPAEQYDAFAKIPGVKVASLPTANSLYLMLHTRKPPTDDVHFRRALSYVINYDVISSQIMPGSPPAEGPVARTLLGHSSDVTRYTYDLAKAEEELKKSKYYGKLDQYPLDVAWIAETPDREKLALLIQSEAQKVGIKVNVVKVPWLSFIDQAAKEETTPGSALVAVGPHYAEAGSILESRFHSRSTGTWEQAEWLKDPQIDAMIDDAIGTTDQQARVEKYAQIQKRVTEDAIGIPLVDMAERHAYQAQYVSWRQAENAAAGRPVNPVMGYVYYGLDFKVYPDKK